MNPLESRINIELVMEQERTWMDTLRIASVPAKGKDPIFATPVVTTKLMKLGTKTLHRLIDKVFQLTAELFDMGRFLSLDGGSWDKLIWVQDLSIAIQQRYGAAKDSIELVLEASKKSIPDSIKKLRVHEKLMRNYLDM